MDYSIYLRPLRISDATNNIKWGIGSDLCKCTNEMPEQYLQKDIEVGWLSYVFGKTTDKYFAICLNFTDRHIGNIELTNISDHDAQCNILIGENEFWGKGFTTKAVQMASEFAFSYLKLKALNLSIYKNDVAHSVYDKCWFNERESREINLMTFALTTGDQLTNLEIKKLLAQSSGEIALL